eukprot:GHVU01050168.1.p1 GENE.GHVU01050168.1~~GHVU01050168.1.p1  ORF type:complete len:114 (-),score=8.36 GHVU01050168.1:115-456(-)
MNLLHIVAFIAGLAVLPSAQSLIKMGDLSLEDEPSEWSKKCDDLIAPPEGYPRYVGVARLISEELFNSMFKFRTYHMCDGELYFLYRNFLEATAVGAVASVTVHEWSHGFRAK